MRVLTRVAIALTLGASSTLATADPKKGDGFVISGSEVAEIAKLARKGVQPERDLANRIISDAEESWPYGWVGKRFGTVRNNSGSKRCVRLDDSRTEHILTQSAHRIYAKALAYNLTGEGVFAKQARSLLMSFAGSSGFNEVDGTANYTGANQCALDLSLFLPLMIDAAILLERYPGWNPYHKDKLQRWLADVPYKTTAAIARTRKNNWGNAAALASWSIGHYLQGTGLKLEEVYPEQRVLSAHEARDAHLGTQINMMSTKWKGDSRCNVFGIQADGGIPDELRRGSTGCNGSFLAKKDGAYGYQIAAIRSLVYHAEAVRRHMDNELFEYGTANGQPALQRAINFVIDNPTGQSQDWKSSELGILRVASHAYPSKATCVQLGKGKASYYRESLYLPYTKMTRPQSNC